MTTGAPPESCDLGFLCVIYNSQCDQKESGETFSQEGSVLKWGVDSLFDDLTLGNYQLSKIKQVLFFLCVLFLQYSLSFCLQAIWTSMKKK